MAASDNVKRNYGVDIAKIIAMFLVVLFHVIGCGIGFPWSDPGSLSKNAVFSILEAVSLTCIDLFALSTGFLYYKKNTRLSKLIFLWIQVIFWSVVPELVIAVWKKDVSILLNLPKSFMLVSFNRYWYFCAYLILFFLIPFLNSLVYNLKNSQLIALILVFGFLFSIDSFFGQNAFSLSKGSSFPWLAYMYVVGAAIKKNAEFFASKKKLLPAVVSLFCIVCEGVLIFMGDRFPLNTDVKGYNYFLISFPSTLIFICLINISVKKKPVKKALTGLSAVSFSVYLTHLNPTVYDLFIKNKFTFIGQYSLTKAAAAAIGIALAIFGIGIVLGFLQNLLFKLLRVNAFSEWMGTEIKKLWLKTYTKIKNRIVV